MNLDEKYYTATEVAAILRCTETHINRLCRRKRLKAIKPLGKWLIDKEAFNKELGVEVSTNDSSEKGLEI